MNKKFAEFNELLKKDKSLQKQLQAAKNQQDFVKLYCKLAKQKGYEISPQEVKEYLNNIKRNINEDQLNKLAGGISGLELGNLMACHNINSI